MITRRTGFVAGAALAAGLALGFTGSALAAGPTASASHGSMMGGGGMMAGLSGEQSQQMLERCDQIHDVLHASPSAPESPASR